MMTLSVKDLEIRTYQRKRTWEIRATMQSERKGETLARFLRAKEWQVKLERRFLWIVNLARYQMSEAEADIRRWFGEEKR